MASTNIGKRTTINIFRRRGDTKKYVIRLLTAGTTNPIDVTGYSAKLTINTDKEPPDVTDQVFQALGTVTATPIDGKLQFDFAAFDSVAIGDYFYDIEITDVGGLLDTPILGSFKVEQDTTKP